MNGGRRRLLSPENGSYPSDVGEVVLSSVLFLIAGAMWNLLAQRRKETPNFFPSIKPKHQLKKEKGGKRGS